VFTNRFHNGAAGGAIVVANGGWPGITSPPWITIIIEKKKRKEAS
jgi:hypothetical protein